MVVILRNMRRIFRPSELLHEAGALRQWLRLRSLKHVEKEIPGGGNVYVLNRGSVINAEDEAMLQALHSRSVGGFKHHMDILHKKGSGNFISKFYVGYGHKSIGDCGDTTIFVEGVSMLVAKAIQDHPLYNGQEASTRYIDFSSQAFIDPTNSQKGNSVLESQRNFYLSLLGPLVTDLRNKHPISGGEKQEVYEKAINARAFDVARGFLPAGASTNLAWHSNLRQISDKLLFLRHYPLEEVRGVANIIEEAVMEAHPNSFKNKRYPDTEAYQDIIAQHYFFHDSNSPDLEISSNVDLESLANFRSLIGERPPKTELPKFLAQLGDLGAKFKLDFGSFRDLQRHRSINQRMPLLTTEIGFNQWYLDNLPEEQGERALEFLGSLENGLRDLGLSPEDSQYFVPMGYNTSNSISGDLPAMVYVAELRSTRFVHPTLRSIAKAVGEYMQGELDVPIHFDPEPDRFDSERGKQDIVIK